MKRVAIQIITYKSSEFLAPLLKSIKEQSFNDYEVLMYENSADTEEAKRVKDLIDASGLQVAFTVGEKNIGFTAHNFMFAQSDAPLVFVLNDDTLLDPLCLERMVAMLESDPKVAAVTPLIFRVPRGTSERPAISDALTVDTAGHEYRLLSDIRDLGSGKSWGEVKEDLAKSGQVFGVSGTAALYRRKSVLAVSPDATLFDPTFFMYKEDVDLDLRLRRGGWRAWRASSAIVFHGRGVAGTPSFSISRLQQERLRSPLIRKWTYRNTHHLYTYHWSLKLGFRDVVFGFLFEIGRTLGVFVASPSVWFGAASMIIRDFPVAWRRRQKMEQIGLKHVRFLA